MDHDQFSEHWAKAQFCYFRAETSNNRVVKILWIQLAQDWIALSEDIDPEADDQVYDLRMDQPSLVA